MPKSDSGSREFEDTTTGAEDACAVSDHTSQMAEAYGFHVVRVRFDGKWIEEEIRLLIEGPAR